MEIGISRSEAYGFSTIPADKVKFPPVLTMPPPVDPVPPLNVVPLLAPTVEEPVPDKASRSKTVKRTVALCMGPAADVPVIVIGGSVPNAAPLDTFRVKVVELAEEAVGALNDAVTPSGKVVADMVTLPANTPRATMDTQLLAPLPLAAMSLLGLAKSIKSLAVDVETEHSELQLLSPPAL